MRGSAAGANKPEREETVRGSIANAQGETGRACARRNGKGGCEVAAKRVASLKVHAFGIKIVSTETYGPGPELRK